MEKYPVTHHTDAGLVVERGENQFFIRLYVGKSADGTRKYYSKTWRTLERAVQDLFEQKLKRSRGTLEVESSMRLADFINHFLEEVHRPGVSANTYTISTQFIKLYFSPYAVGNKRLKDLTHGDLQKYFNALCEWVSPVTKRPLAHNTVERLSRVLTAALNYAFDNQLIARNPMRKVIRPSRKARKSRRRALTREHLIAFLTYVEENQHLWWIKKLGPIYHLAAETGLRPEEYLALQWKDCRLESSPPTITVERVVIDFKGRGGWSFGDPKTLKSARTLPITRELAGRLQRHKAVIAELRERAGDQWTDYDLVFPSRFGNPIKQDVTARVFRTICEKLGWTDGRYCAYSLRHSMASLALLGNVNLKVISERLGHASIKTTADVYAHVVPSLQEAATEEIGNILYKRDPPSGSTPNAFHVQDESNGEASELVN
jgi:integrase